jgi:hypothetical protein
MARRKIIFVSLIYLPIAVLSARAPAQVAEIARLNNKVAESFDIRWRSIEYEKALYNPALTSNKRGQPKAESLFLSFEFQMPGSGLILSTCPDAVIERITDRRGGNIEIRALPSRTTFMYTPNLRIMRGFSSGPERSTFKVELDAGLLERINEDIGIKGHFYALVAESFENLELPFEPNDNWVDITPDVEIRVSEARNEASWYRFEIEQRPEIVPDLMAVRVGDYLPGRFVVDRQIIVQTNAMSAGSGASGCIGGTGSGTGRAEKIRFTIAVNPTHQKIPFEFEKIPLSALAEPVPSQASSSNRIESTSVKRMTEQVKPQFDKKVADYFEVKWSSITYSNSLFNPALSAKSEYQRVSENLLVRCEAKILDPELIVGTSDIPVIEQITDGKGRDANISRAQPHSSRVFYHTLRYGMNLSPPSKLLQWEGRIRLALGLPLKVRHRPRQSLALQPVRLFIQLDPELLRQDIREIGSIKGYFHALTAESLKHVKVPFESSDKWVRLTSDVEIQVSKVLQTGSSSRFEISQRGQAGRHRAPLCVGDGLTDEIVVDRRFIGADGQSNSLRDRGGRQLPASIGGSGSIGGRQVEKIDFLIAIDPNHNRITFEFEHIPLPEP